MRGYFKRTPKSYSIKEMPQIDDSETVKRFGYPATSVSPSGNRKVVCVCELCGNYIERIRMRVRPPVLCHSCVKTKINKGSLQGLVSEEETIKRFGYSPKTLPRHSLKQVIGICSVCGNNYISRLKSIKNGQKCRPCIRNDWCIKHFKPRQDDGKNILNDVETIKQFGYSATALSPKSFDMVIATCLCGKTYPRIRRNIKDNSLCVSCSRQQINHEKLQAKRLQTIKEHYPQGIPQSPNSGLTANLLGDYLSEMLGRVIVREKHLANGQRIDLFDAKTNTGIEYCGLYWHHENSATPRDRHYHENKMLAAQKEGFRLITIFEDEYLERELAVKNRLLSILGYGKVVLPARKCEILSLDFETSRSFLEQHHIQGSPTACNYSFGLLYANVLVGIMLGGPHHRQGHPEELILSRLCFAPQISIIGGSKRLFRKLTISGRNDGYKKIITWSDNRWTNGEVYKHLGMTPLKSIPPDYAYVVIAKPRKRLSKQSQQKSRTGCPADITEYQWCLQHGLSRIWDCGRIKWGFTL
jgi:hypothetical protein